MKLYYLPGTCPLASHIVLEWIGKPYEAQEVSREEIKKAPYLAMNPLGAVPVLTDGDFTLTQSAAILQYLAEMNPEAGLMPDNPQGRAEVRRWLSLCNADIHRTFSNLFGAQKLVSSESAQQELIDASSTKLIALFEVVNDRLKGREWVTGTRSIVDPYLYTVMRWAKAKQVDLSHLSELQAFFSRMASDKGVQAALKAEGLS